MVSGLKDIGRDSFLVRDCTEVSLLLHDALLLSTMVRVQQPWNLLTSRSASSP